MKYCALIFFALLSISPSFAQKAMRFDVAAENQKSASHLDSLYKSAVHTNPDLAAFKSEAQQKLLVEAYQNLLGKLAKYLQEKKFKWGKTVRCFNRIYFDKNGTIDYFLYSFPKGEITVEQENQFNQLLNSFILAQKIDISAEEKFAQCSPVKYTDL